MNHNPKLQDLQKDQMKLAHTDNMIKEWIQFTINEDCSIKTKYMKENIEERFWNTFSWSLEKRMFQILMTSYRYATP